MFVSLTTVDLFCMQACSTGKKWWDGQWTCKIFKQVVICQLPLLVSKEWFTCIFTI